MRTATAPSAVPPAARFRDGVVSSLISDIVSGDSSAGATLPTEPQLVARFGVSRTVVREAIRLLEEKGLIRVFQGRGAVVLERTHWNVLDPLVLRTELAKGATDEMLEQLFSVRIALECSMVEAAARLATEDELREMRVVLDMAQRLRGDSSEYLDADLSFHELLARASRNRLAESIMRTIREPLMQSREMTNLIPGGVRRARMFHEEIYDRVRDRDPDGAARSMREHLEWARGSLGEPRRKNGRTKGEQR